MLESQSAEKLVQGVTENDVPKITPGSVPVKQKSTNVTGASAPASPGSKATATGKPKLEQEVSERIVKAKELKQVDASDFPKA